MKKLLAKYEILLYTVNEIVPMCVGKNAIDKNLKSCLSPFCMHFLRMTNTPAKKTEYSLYLFISELMFLFIFLV